MFVAESRKERYSQVTPPICVQMGTCRFTLYMHGDEEINLVQRPLIVNRTTVTSSARYAISRTSQVYRTKITRNLVQKMVGSVSDTGLYCGATKNNEAWQSRQWTEASRLPYWGLKKKNGLFVQFRINCAKKKSARYYFFQ